MSRDHFNPRVWLRNWLIKPTADELGQQMLQIKAREVEQAQLEQQEAQARAEWALILSAYEAVSYVPLDVAASRQSPVPDWPVQSAAAVEKAANAPIGRPNVAGCLKPTQQMSGAPLQCTGDEQ